MSGGEMSSLERVLKALGHEEPDRVPFFLMATTHGARELGLTIEEYFSKGEHVAEGRLRLRSRFRHDCLYAFFYAALEVEAWGGEVVYAEDGPPNSGRPLIERPEDIEALEPPEVREARCLRKVLRAIDLLADRSEGVPIIGVVMSPFSLPVMQMGFGPYLDLMAERPGLFDRLMTVNEAFCVRWANAQLDSGATAICYFDPVSSPTIVPRGQYLRTGFEVARRTLPRIHGSTATHLASGRTKPIIDDLVRTGTSIVGVSGAEDLGEIKSACAGRLTVLGNLRGIEMARWTVEEAEANVKAAIAGGAPGGGFILSDNHGEIPFQVPEQVLAAVSEAVHRWGEYPVDWAGLNDE